MHLTQILHFTAVSILLFLSTIQCTAISRHPAPSSHALEKKTLYHDQTADARYFLNSFASIEPWGIGTSPISMAAMYRHAIALILQMGRDQPQRSSLGFHMQHLSLSFATTNGEPIPWPTALSFVEEMLKFVERRFIGPEFQAFVTNTALGVTIEVSLRLLLDGPLPSRIND